MFSMSCEYWLGAAFAKDKLMHMAKRQLIIPTLNQGLNKYWNWRTNVYVGNLGLNILTFLNSYIWEQPILFTCDAKLKDLREGIEENSWEY